MIYKSDSNSIITKFELAQMRQKLDNYRKQIRREQLTQYFRERREELTASYQKNSKEI